MKTLLLLGALSFGISAAEAPAPISAQVLADAQQASLPKLPVPSPAALQTADEVDVLLLTAGTFLAKQQPEKAGERFIAAVQAMEKISRIDKRALGQRYTEQRRQLAQMANELLRDPTVAAALGDAPLVPLPAEQQAILTAPGLPAVGPAKP